MPWHYFNEIGEKIGPITDKELKHFAQHGVITPETIIETKDGKTVPARRIEGLMPPETVQPEPEKPFIAASPFSVQNDSAPSPATAFAAQTVQAVRTHGQKTAKSAMFWLFDFAFRDIRIHVVNLWFCRIIYVLCWISAILYGVG